MKDTEATLKNGWFVFDSEVKIAMRAVNNVGIAKYIVDNDKFEPDDDDMSFTLKFPCCACKHKYRSDADEPCRSCGRNVNANTKTGGATDATNKP